MKYGLYITLFILFVSVINANNITNNVSISENLTDNVGLTENLTNNITNINKVTNNVSIESIGDLNPSNITEPINETVKEVVKPKPKDPVDWSMFAVPLLVVFFVLIGIIFIVSWVIYSIKKEKTPSIFENKNQGKVKERDEYDSIVAELEEHLK